MLSVNHWEKLIFFNSFNPKLINFILYIMPKFNFESLFFNDPIVNKPVYLLKFCSKLNKLPLFRKLISLPFSWFFQIFRNLNNLIPFSFENLEVFTQFWDFGRFPFTAVWMVPSIDFRLHKMEDRSLKLPVFHAWKIYFLVWYK